MHSLDLIPSALPPSIPAALPVPRPLVQLALRIGGVSVGLIVDFRCFALVAYRGKKRVLHISYGDLG